MDRHHGHPAGRRLRSQADPPLRHPRWFGAPRRPDRRPGPLSRARPARRKRPDPARVPQQGPPDRGPVGLLPGFLLHRPVVPEARGLRGGQRLERPCLSSELGVLRRLRRFRRPYRRPQPFRRRILGQTDRGRGRRRRRTDDLHLPSGHGPRFRLDGRPPLHQDREGLHRRQGSHTRGIRGDRRAPRPAARRGPSPRCPDDPGHRAGAQRPDRAPLPGPPGGPQILRTLVRPLSLRDRDHGRPALPDRERRHGVSDPVHRGHAGPRQPQRPLAGGRHRPRVRPRLLVRAGGQQRIRGGLARRGLQHLFDG